MARKSPFVVHKAIIGIGGEPKSIKKLRSGDLLIETTSALQKKKQAKNTSVKIAREQDSPNDSTPVSKRSRRRKTSKTLDAMNTDVDPSDTDYVTGLASEEDESLLEADFKQVADNPLKGPLLPSSPKK
ncbi:hypothetical protein TNCV_2453201 [Trichonephila clavipes]|nr:hypothetical protein TNCV_2453201 [Trichonephila clavipes]